MANRYAAVYALAKSKELSLSDEDLHGLVYAETKKDSLRKLNDRELSKVIARLQSIKDGIHKDRNYSRRGRRGTQNQRKKIYMLMKDLDWNEGRVKRLAKKLFHVDALEWLDYGQCSKMIEALKAILEREEKKDV